ncbi:MAG: glycerophosphodiester phosphodiesterase, partial [Oscillospiraceae bacterium]|nr:glycerophosphodiester phosphodiesterase [Oscillospiraceae bacterium]
AAFAAGADGIELDVQLSRDGQLVIIHDETLDRTTTGKGYVKDYTLSELKQLDASGQQIPDFEEYCKWVKDTSLVTNVELKTSIVYYEEIEEKTTEMVKAFHLEDRVIFSSFNHLSVVRMKQLLPECPVGALVEHDDLQNAGYYCRKFGFEYYHPDGSLFTKENADNCREHGVGVNVWTVNDLKMFENMADWGVDGVITNYPKVLAELMHR